MRCPEVLRNSRRVVRFESVRLVEFIGRSMVAFAESELFIAVGPIMPFRPALGKTVSWRLVWYGRLWRARSDVPYPRAPSPFPVASDNGFSRVNSGFVNIKNNLTLTLSGCETRGWP